jgi:hypothetical protein
VRAKCLCSVVPTKETKLEVVGTITRKISIPDPRGSYASPYHRKSPASLGFFLMISINGFVYALKMSYTGE